MKKATPSCTLPLLRPVMMLMMMTLNATATLSTTAHAAVVGQTSGEFSVDPTGAANYQIPIRVPPGTAGMQPTLALLYNSRAGNGLMGFGWSISGMSAITRCGTTIAQDNVAFVDGVDLEADDRFCLDGQRLFEVGDEYRTEIASFQRVQPFGSYGSGPEHFEVRDKGGLIRTYGGVSEGLIPAGSSGEALLWAVSRIADRFGNFIQFNYAVDDTANEYRPDTIAWYNNQGNLLGRVVFHYETRTDADASYVAGQRLSTVRLLASIAVYGRTGFVRRYDLHYATAANTRNYLEAVTQCASENGAGLCLRPTRFTWQHAQAGYLATVGSPVTGAIPKDHAKYMDVDGDGLPDVVYPDGNWQIRFATDIHTAHDTGIDAGGAQAPPYSYEGRHTQVIDYNGDGRDDLLLPEIVGTGDALRAEGQWLLLRSTGDSLVFAGGVADHLGGFHHATSVVDVEGDGLPELLFRNDQGDKTLQFLPNGANGFGAPVDTGYRVTDLQRFAAVSFDSDGRADLYVSTADCLSNPSPNTCDDTAGFLTSTGTGFVDAGPALPFGYQPVFLDVNGDGLTDYAYHDRLGLDKWQLCTNKGGGSPHFFCQDVGAQNQLLEPEIAFSADYNGDGRDDLYLQRTAGSNSSDSWHVMLSSGETLLPPIDTGLEHRGATVAATFAALDISGDGLAELVHFEGDQLWFNVRLGPVGGLLAAVETGFGDLTQIAYASMADPDYSGWVFEGSADAGLGGADVQFPVRHAGGALLAVRAIGRSTGVGDERVYTNYAYRGAKSHVQGRGFLGFERVTAHNANTEILTFNHHRQDFPYTGMVERTEQWVPQMTPSSLDEDSIGQDFTPDDGEGEISCNPGLHGFCQALPRTGEDGKADNALMRNTYAQAEDRISSVENTLEQRTVLGGRLFPFTQRSVVKDYDFGSSGSLFRQVETLSSYDANGNLETIEVTTTDGAGTGSEHDEHRTTTVNEFADDTGSLWCLGRLVSSTVTHTRPDYGTGNQAPLTSTTSASFAYDMAGGSCQMTEETTLPGTNQWLTKRYQFDTFGNVKLETVSGADIEQRRMQTLFDEFGQFPVQSVNDLGHREYRQWSDSFGKPRFVTGPNGLISEMDYDEFGRNTLEVAPQTSIWKQTSYDWCEDAVPACLADGVYRVTQTGSDGSLAVNEIDRLGRTIRTRTLSLNDLPVLQDSRFDPAGRSYASTAPYFADGEPCWTFRRFDNLGRETHVHEPANDAECASQNAAWAGTLSHDTPPTQYTRNTAIGYNGLITIAINPNARKIVRTVNVMDRLLRVNDIGAIASQTRYDYDPLGNTSWVQDDAGNETHIAYDDRGNKTSMDDPDMGRWTYVSNVLGQLVRQVDARGLVTKQYYDTLGRLVERVGNAHTGSPWDDPIVPIDPTVPRQRNARGITGSKPPPPERLTYWYYDSADGAGIGKIAAKTGPQAYWQGYAYDQYGNVTDTVRVIDDQIFYTSYTYDDQGRVKNLLYPDITTAATSDLVAPLSVSTPATAIGSVNVSWVPAANPAITHFEVYQAIASSDLDDARLAYSGNDTATEIVVREMGLHYYWTRACVGSSCSAFTAASQPVDVLGIYPLPGTPTLAVDAAGNLSLDGRYELAWSLPDTTGVTRYELLETDLDAGAAPVTFTTTNSYIAITKTPDARAGRWQYTVRACSEEACGNDSAPVTVNVILSPTAPQDLSVSCAESNCGDGNVDLSWIAATGSNVQYNLYRNTANNADTAMLHQSGLTGTTAESTDLVDGATYYFWLEAYNESGVSDRIAGNTPVQVLFSPDAPAVSLTTQQSGNTDFDGSFTVSWSASGNVNTFRVFEAAEPHYTSTPGSFTQLGSDLDGTVQNLAVDRDNGKYWYKIEACNDTGCAQSGVVGPVHVMLQPAAPDSLQVTPDSPPNFDADGQFPVAWQAPTASDQVWTNFKVQETWVLSGSPDWNANARTPIVYSCTENAQTNTCPAGTGLQGTVTLPSADLSRLYYYRVQTCNYSHCSGWRQANSFVRRLGNAPPADIHAPDSSATGDYTVSWHAPEGNSDWVNGYRLQEARDGEYAWGNGPEWSTPSLSQLVTDRSSGTYRYRVKACRDSDCSVWNECLNDDAVTCDNNTVVVSIPAPAPPSLTASATTVDQGVPFTLSWSTVTGTAHYQLWQSTSIGTLGARIGGDLQGPGYVHSVTMTDAPSRAYYYRVLACNTEDNCSESNQVSVTVEYPPSVPRNLRSDDTPVSCDGLYAVSWDTPASSLPTGQVFLYTLTENANALPATTGRSVSIDHSNAWDVPDFDYTVQACYQSAPDICSATLSGLTVTVVLDVDCADTPPNPQAPPVPVVTSVTGPNGSGSVTVDWNAVSVEPALADNLVYNIHYSNADAGGTNTEEVRAPATVGSVALTCNGSWDVSVTACIDIPLSQDVCSAPSGTTPLTAQMSGFANCDGTSTGIPVPPGVIAPSSAESGGNYDVSCNLVPPALYAGPLTYQISERKADNSEPDAGSITTSGDCRRDDINHTVQGDPGTFENYYYWARACTPDLSDCSEWTSPAKKVKVIVPESCLPFCRTLDKEKASAPGQRIARLRPAAQSSSPASMKHIAAAPVPVLANTRSGVISSDPPFRAAARFASQRIIPRRHDPRLPAADAAAESEPQFSAAATRRSYWDGFAPKPGGNSKARYAHMLEYSYHNGYLVQVASAPDDGTSPVVYWRADSSDALGNITQATLGNGVVTRRSHDQATGVARTVVSGMGGTGTEVQDEAYQWDNVNNLTRRTYSLHGATTQTVDETFAYDAIDRLKSWTLNLGLPGSDDLVQSYDYDSIGNLLRKGDDYTSYNYATPESPYAYPQPHAVKSLMTPAGPRQYAYDANGNMTRASSPSGPSRKVTWTTFNKPAAIYASGVSSQFLYDPDRRRYKQTRRDANGNASTVLYVGSEYEQHESAAGTEHRHFIRVGDQVVAMYSRWTTGEQSTRYLHRDHLSSISAITDEAGNVEERWLYDAWGKRRPFPSLLTPAPGEVVASAVTSRGYTGHEHLEPFNLIHMNGRIYDPEIGRFLSADIFIQFPESTQGYNRYTYVGNNPLSYNDPSGHFITLAATVIAGAIGVGEGALVATAFIAGAVEGYLTTGNFAGALQNGLFTIASMGITQGIGFAHKAGELNLLQAAFAHGVAQGGLSAARGGRFGDGFLSAATSKLLSPVTMKIPGSSEGAKITRSIVAGVAGGTAAQIGGGKFANGAITAAFVQRFNGESDDPEPRMAPGDPEDFPILKQMHDLAYDAAAEVDANCTGFCRLPWVRGTRIHKVFADKVRALGTDYSAEISYKNRLVVHYGKKGSVRADAVYGDLAAPKFVVELKTGYFNYLSRGEAKAYLKHLPRETDIYPLKVP